MSYNPNQFYLDFVYEEYFKYHSPLTYILTIFDYIDWSLVHDIKNTGVGRTGYSPVSMIKALLFKTIKKIHSIRELINELYSNPYLAQIMGFDPIRNYVPSESTFSNFRKSFHINIIYSIITDLLFRGISDGFISTDLVIVDSFPIPFDSHFNNPKSFNNFSDDFSTYYSTPLDADFGVKPINDNIRFYDKHGNPKNIFFYVGYKGHTISFFNIPIFTIVTPASIDDKSVSLNLLICLCSILKLLVQKLLLIRVMTLLRFMILFIMFLAVSLLSL
ncbi:MULTISPECIES: transposase [Marinitoga]|jgi:transposase|uniref:transposase n=1 Tax=Marinitoga TaxID=160798 RepID=UPI0013EC0360|nr:MULTISPECIES: transposase [Marinitoga]KAF2955288.1 hypothetical protein AS160_10875 [Marinitoga sp. 38H-ov]MBM7560448.1 transposase [Marinitoga litoralis]